MSVKLIIYATNCKAICVHTKHYSLIKNKNFSALAWHGLY